MVTAAFVSLGLLWLLMVTEGVLLFILYRHVGLLYARKSGLPVNSQAPALVARDSQAKVRTLSQLLVTDYTLLIFGSLTCAGCRVLLTDPEVHAFLLKRGMPGYFIAELSGAPRSEISNEALLDVLAVEGKTFTDYAIRGTPFAYVLRHDGTIAARASVAGKLTSLVELCDLATGLHRVDERALMPNVAPSQVGH